MSIRQPGARTAARSLLLWAVLLLFGQTVALAHQHESDLPGASCAVCTLAKAETAACDHATAAAPPDRAYTPRPPVSTAAAEILHARQFQARAPPLA